jgi:hypothetical protein
MEFFKGFNRENSNENEGEVPRPPKRETSWWTRSKLGTAVTPFSV